jgi:hypothetical protein
MPVSIAKPVEVEAGVNVIPADSPIPLSNVELYDTYTDEEYTVLAIPVVLSPLVNQPSIYPFKDTPSAIAAEADITVAKPVAAIIFDLFIIFFLL